MPVSSKRRFSEREISEKNLRLKRRPFILSNHAETPRSGSSFSCFSSGLEDQDLHDDATCLLGNTVLNAKLAEAVSRCSDSDATVKSDREYSYHIGGGANVRQKSMSRPGSFSSSSRKSQVSKSDLAARERCFDYIVQSIDEVWARYCDTTSSAEAVVYNNFAKKSKVGVKLSSIQSHRCLNISENETESDNGTVAGTEELESEYDDDSSGYKSEATNPTEYETDHGENRTVSNLPDSIKLQSLKHRLTKAKNDLEQVYDSKQLEGSVSFWRRWDMIKYSAVEMMEDDDDDEVIENAIEELEQGRYYTC